MFSIQEQRATLAHLNVRTERHGDEPAGGADLKIVITDSNGILSEFHPTLRSCFYKIEDAPEQGKVIPGEQLSVRRFGDLIGAIRLKHELKGADVSISFGLGGASDIKLETVDVDGFNIELLEGGSVTYSFRVKCHPTGEQVKKLYEVLGGDISVSVRPAQDKQASLDMEAA